MSSGYDIPILKYDLPIFLSRHLNLTFIQNIINDIIQNNNISNLIKLHIYPNLLEQYNIGYTERWIKGIDKNFVMYHFGIKPSLIQPSQPLKNLKYLSFKFFSGDVSGMIAESLFIYLLDKLKIDIKLVGHLRPYKAKDNFVPDFIIWSNSQGLRKLISATDYELPIYAEVKGSTKEISKQRLGKALSQLNKVVRNRNYGIVFLAYKNPINYVGIVIEVRP